jgi:hypothetical protein
MVILRNALIVRKKIIIGNAREKLRASGTVK